jgi:hypothetical protein
MRRASINILFALLTVLLALFLGSAQAKVPDALLGRWVVVRVGSQPAHAPFKLWLYQDASSFPDDEQYGIARFDLDAYGRETCFFAVEGFDIVGPTEFQKRYPQVPYMLCTRIENGSAADFCNEQADVNECIDHAMADEKQLDNLIGATALKWRKTRGGITIYSIDGDGAEIVLAPDPAWPRS